jgi:DNA polymerase alpha subunit A
LIGFSKSTFEAKKILSGRLVCDTYLSSQEYLKEDSNSLKSLVKSYIKNDIEFEIKMIDYESSNLERYFKSDKTILNIIRATEQYAYASLILMFKLSVIPLSKALSNSAGFFKLLTTSGNIWSKSLTGSRAERIEYLLLHEFYNNQFILPDKKLYNNKTEDVDKKGSYKGGQVIAPIKGLYDKYVLLLDFNSLYPSIILERNLCFTTVERDYENEKEEEVKKKEEEEEEEEESEDKALLNEKKRKKEEKEKEEYDNKLLSTKIRDDVESVLPKVISMLLKKRNDVKNLLKNERDENKKWELDIKQRSLKLIANSTYGCLGFKLSRFYCKKIAELITVNGRSLLLRTKDDIEQKLGYNIIYGDTDSVRMI